MDVAVLAKELTMIYSTTPKGWPESKQVNNLYWIDCVLQQPGFDIYTRSLKMNPTRVRLSTIFGTKKTFLFEDNLDPNLCPFVESDMYLPDANHISLSLFADVIQREPIPVSHPNRLISTLKQSTP